MPIKKYLLIYKENSPKDWEEALALEKLGSSLVAEMQDIGRIEEQKAIDFINRTEKWKAMGIKERILGEGRNTPKAARTALEGAINGNTDQLQIESLHTLIGFGASKHEEYGTHPAKVASAAMRFLFPSKWGVVDWRSGAIASCLIDGLDITEAMDKAKKRNRNDWIDDFSHIDSNWAIKLNQQYRKIGTRFKIENNSEVDQFLFAISLEIWPLKAGKC